ncbi:hypothetical protein DFA_12176 [Cavenderia fasciculata]|uniref:Uncharacterized protein n=1 Tax=Cavenderia fasciculata TaxID=261658 RepID=F4QCC3_CACFS|nr:uncharacterized protein DFA_12176 [Cavenderia fasciculata]EGG14404.1 hypothetical protein DFA_12176 [Cavenderia fasciculata]|eukprot:XP_004353813.1 hypothetical protein DFA_12176 [Cavenderia fasciculata]
MNTVEHPVLEFVQLIIQSSKVDSEIEIQKYIDGTPIDDIISWILYLQTQQEDDTDTTADDVNLRSNSNRFFLLRIVQQSINKPLLVRLLKSKVTESIKQTKTIKNLDTIIEAIQLVSDLLYPIGEWNDYFKTLIDLIQNENDEPSRYAGMRLLVKANKRFHNNIKYKLELLKMVAVTGLKDNTTTRIRFASLDLCIKLYPKKSSKHQIIDQAIPLIMPIIGQAYQVGEIELVEKGLRVLLRLSKKKSYTKHSIIFIDTLLPIIVDQPVAERSLVEPIKEMSYKLLMSVKWKHQKHQLEPFISSIFSNVVDRVEDNCLDNWNNSTTNGPDIDDGANEMIRKLVENLVKPDLWTSTLEECKKRVNSVCWRDRYAALIIITKMVPELNEIFEENVQKTLEIENLINIEESFPTIMVQQLISTIEIAVQDSNDRVKLACCQFVQSFLVHCKEDALKSMKPNNLFIALEHLLESPHPNVVECALTTFTIAQRRDISYNFFSKTIILKMIENYKCKSPIALGAIKIFIEKNGKRFLKQFKSLFQNVSGQRDNFNLLSEYIEICATASKSLGKDYSIYLAPTMKIILDILNQDIEPTGDYKKDEAHKRFRVDALKTLKPFLKSCKSIISPYLESLVDACTRSFSVSGQDYISFGATKLLLGICIEKYNVNSQQTKTLYSRIVNSILESCSLSGTPIKYPKQRLVIACQLTEMMDDHFMTFEQIQDSISKVWIVKKRFFGLLDGEEDEIVGQITSDNTLPELIATLYKLVGQIVKKNQDIAINVIVKRDIVQDTLQVLVDRSENETLHISILQMFADICEYGGQPSIVLLYPLIIPVMIDHLSSENVEIAHLAAVGLGVAAVNSKEQFAPYVFNVLMQLNDLISCNENRKKKNKVPATESAISAIGKLIRHVPQLAPQVGQIIPDWLERLPVKKHKENVQCLENLYHIMQLYPNECLGGNQMTNVDRIKHIVCKYTTDTELQTRAKQMYKDLKQNYSKLVTYNRGQQACDNIQSLLSILIKETEEDNQKD